MHRSWSAVGGHDDGIDDLHTGCFEGGVYVLAGSKPGEFAAPQKLLDKAGNTLRLGQYWDYEKKEWTGVPDSKFKESLGIGATAVDWDNDGDLDLARISHCAAETGGLLES